MGEYVKKDELEKWLKKYWTTPVYLAVEAEELPTVKIEVPDWKWEGEFGSVEYLAQMHCLFEKFVNKQVKVTITEIKEDK